MKTITISTMVLMVLSSCYTVKRVTQKDEPITSETFNKLTPGKSYIFKMKNHEVYVLHFDKIEDSTFYGQVKARKRKPSEGFIKYGKEDRPVYRQDLSELSHQIEKITFTRFNPYLTIGIPVVLTGIVLLGIQSVDIY